MEKCEAPDNDEDVYTDESLPIERDLTDDDASMIKLDVENEESQVTINAPLYGMPTLDVQIARGAESPSSPTADETETSVAVGHDFSTSDKSDTSTGASQDESLVPCSVFSETGIHTQHAMVGHMKTHDDRPRPYACGDCVETFATRSQLRTHGSKSHRKLTGKRADPPVTTVETCVAHVMFSPSIVSSPPPPVGVVVCAVCHMSVYKSMFSKHLASHGSIARPYACDEGCTQTNFTSAYALGQHLRTRHGGEEASRRRRTCNVCSVLMRSRSYIIAHMRSHEPRRRRGAQIAVKLPQLVVAKKTKKKDASSHAHDGPSATRKRERANVRNDDVPNARSSLPSTRTAKKSRSAATTPEEKKRKRQASIAALLLSLPDTATTKQKMKILDLLDVCDGE